MKRLFWATLVAMTILLGWHIDLWYTPNPTSRAMLVASIVEDHAYQVDRFRNWSEDRAFVRGHYYSDKAPLSSWITAPIYALFTWLSGAKSQSGPHPATLISGSIMSGVLPALGFLALLLAALSRRGASPTVSVLYVMSAIPGSLIGLYSGTFFGHILAGFFLCLAWRSLFHQCRPFLAGLFLGFSCLAEFPLLIFVPFFLLGLAQDKTHQNRRRYIDLGIGLLPGTLLIILHNLLTTGQALEFAYKHVDSPSFQHMKQLYGFRLPQLEAIWGLTFSLSHGLLVHAPSLIVLGVALVLKSPIKLRGLFRSARVVALLGYFIFVSSYQMWQGGWSFGPRHLIPITMVLFLEGTVLGPSLAASSWRVALGLSALAGGSLVFFAKATSLYMIPSSIHFPLTELMIPKLLRGEWNPNTILTWTLPISARHSHLLWALTVVGLFVWLYWNARVLERQVIRTESLKK